MYVLSFYLCPLEGDLCLASSPSDKLPEQCDRGSAAEERGAEDQTEEARSG